MMGDKHGSDILSNASTIPGDSEPGLHQHVVWTLKEMQMPPEIVINALVDSYFYRIHWFILILHEPSFRTQVCELLQKSRWSNEDRGAVTLILVVAAVGLFSGLEDETWSGLDLLRDYSIDPQKLLQDCISESRVQLWDILDGCLIEGVQITSLLSSFYAFSSSPALAWTTSGMAIRASYALSLDSKQWVVEDPIAEQIRHRCWNHMIVSDAFTSLIHGRHSMIDASINDLHTLCEIDDTSLHGSLGELNQEYGPVTKLSFHKFKSRLYLIINQALAQFRLLQRDSTDILTPLLHAVDQAYTSLIKWRSELPRFFDYEQWNNGDPWQTFETRIEALPEPGRESGRTLLLQAMTLQVTYDSAVILVHRPLLECIFSRASRPASSSKVVQVSIQRSLDLATEAALRISRVHVPRVEKHLTVSFVFMHLFIAGVILCISPMTQPFSSSAQEAKAGVIRIVRGSRAMRRKSRIAKHTEQLLTELLKVTHQREMENALNTTVFPVMGENVSGFIPIAESWKTRNSQNLSTNNNQYLSDPNDRDVRSTQGSIHSMFIDQSPPTEPGTQPTNSWPEMEPMEPQIDPTASYVYGEFHADEQLDQTFRSFGESKAPLSLPYS